MAVSRQLRCSPEDVFAVLADGWSYASWVVGASRMRDVDHSWPAEGAKLHHSAGVWPLLINDTTILRTWRPPYEAVLEAHGWPAGEAEVQITVEVAAGGCAVAIEENVIKGPALLVPKPVRDAAMAWRNTETLRRLSYLAERKIAS
ncbi:MAG: SRPBCC family protein [Actinomycetes bacterium]